MWKQRITFKNIIDSLSLKMSARNAHAIRVRLTAIICIVIIGSPPIIIPIDEIKARPRHFEIVSALNAANGFINSLYKDALGSEVDASNKALIAEYPGIPIRILQSDGRIVRIGEDISTSSNNSAMKTSFIYDYAEMNPHTIEFKISFRTSDGLGKIYDNVPMLKVRVSYGLGSNESTVVSIVNLTWQANPVVSWADVYFGTYFLGKASQNNIGQNWMWSSNSSLVNDIAFRSIRYTERHATALGREWYNAIGDVPRSAKLSNSLLADGYTQGKDLYSPLFHTDSGFGRNYLYEAGPNGPYRDCYVAPVLHELSYPYQSKVCKIGVDFYISYSRMTDVLVPMLWAIHSLNIDSSSDQLVFDGYTFSSSREVARMVESMWKADYGFEYYHFSSYASGIKTAVFLTLETILGHKYGDERSKIFADKAAIALLYSQIKNSGQIINEGSDGNKVIYQRPLYAGAFPIAWSNLFHEKEKSDIEVIPNMFGQQEETPDIKPSNAETTIVVAQSLRIYDCYRYGYNCTNVP